MIILFLCLMNTVVTTIIQAFRKPDLTETERFLLLPKNFVWKFK